MRKLIYCLFMLAGFIPSILSNSAQASVALPSEKLDASNPSELQINENNFMYFGDILDNQENSNFVAAHYSHRSHSSHVSHASHTSSRY